MINFGSLALYVSFSLLNLSNGSSERFIGSEREESESENATLKGEKFREVSLICLIKPSLSRLLFNYGYTFHTTLFILQMWNGLRY